MGVIIASLAVTPTSRATAIHPPMLVSYGNTLYRVSDQVVETFPGQPGSLIGMTVVPPETIVSGANPGDILAIEGSGGTRIWRIDNARSGTPSLMLIGNFPGDHTRGDIAFTQGRLYGVNAGFIYQYDPVDFSLITTIDLERPNASSGGIAHNGSDHFYIANQFSNRLIELADPPTPASWNPIGDSGVTFGNNDLEFHRGTLWAAMVVSGRLLVGTFDTGSGSFTQTFDVAPTLGSFGVGLAMLDPYCVSDYNADGTPSEILDLLDFLQDFAGCDGSPAPCGTIGNPDLNGDGSIDVLDLLDFLQAFSAGC